MIKSMRGIALVITLLLIAVMLPSRGETRKAPPTYIKLRQEREARKRSEKAGDENKVHPWMVAAGPSFFMALGEVGNSLQPGFLAGKVMVQYLQAPQSIHGFSFDVNSAYLKDKVYDGSILYISAIPYYAITFSPGKILDLQLKLGGGISHIRSEITSGSSATGSSTDFTFSAAFTVMKTFQHHYVVGLENTVYYYFERKSSAAWGLNFFLGYRI